MKNMIRTYRESRQMTQENVARQLGCTLRYYQRIENGDSVPTVYKALRLSDILGVDVHALFSYDAIP